MTKETKTFKVLSLKSIKESASKAKRIVDTKRKNTTKKVRLTPLEEKYKDVKPIYEFFTQINSIQEYIDQTHPDIKDFIDTNKPIKYVAEAGRLVITMNNKYRIEIKTTGKYTRQIIIKDNKNKIVFNGISEVLISKQVNQQKVA